MNSLLKDLLLVVRALRAAVRAAFVAGWFALRVVLLLVGIVQSLHILKRGLTCPRGHPVPTEGGVYSCSGCGFVYEGGSQWLCPNPECGASTPYVNCPTCGLSVSSPFRFLHR